MSLTAYPTLRLKLTMPQALKLQFLPAIPGSNAAAAVAAAEAAAAEATAAAAAATAATINKVDRTGDVMTGFLTLQADPTSNLHASTKQYVDARTSAIAGLAASKLAGRGSASGTGALEEITLGTNLTMSGTTLNAATGGSSISDGDKGDITVSGSGATWTIDNDAVTYAKLQNVSATARFLGRITSGAGDTEELTGTQATTLLDVFTSTLKGLAPLSGGGTTTFLRADGSWATPPGGGGGLSDAFQVITDGTTLATATGAGTFKLRATSPLTVATQNNDATHGDNALFAMANVTVGDITITGAGSTWTIGTNVVSNAKLRQGAAKSVIGVTGNATANVADITGTTDQVLRVNDTGTALAFGMVATGGITNSAVTYSKLQNSSAASVLIGRGSAGGAGVLQEITLGPSMSMTGTVLDAGGFPSGTLMLFQQTSAPTGWTKQTTHNDKALRVVSGTASSGGSVAFSTVFGKTATDGFTLTQTEMPAHVHTFNSGTQVPMTNLGAFANFEFSGPNSLTGATMDAVGGSGSHAHGMDIRVHYVDLIIASKN